MVEAPEFHLLAHSSSMSIILNAAVSVGLPTRNDSQLVALQNCFILIAAVLTFVLDGEDHDLVAWEAVGLLFSDFEY